VIAENIARQMGISVDDAIAHCRWNADVLMTAYASRGCRYFWSEIDTQTSVALLDRAAASKCPRVAAFQAQHGAKLMDDIDACDAWLRDPARAPPRLVAALNLLQMWLRYALLDVRKLCDWEPYARALCKSAPASLPTLVSLLKRVVDYADEVRELALRADVLDANDTQLAHEELYAQCVDETDHAVRDMLFDALLSASARVRGLTTLSQRLRFQRNFTKQLVLEQRAQPPPPPN
jgi:hypothetical protein